MTTTVWELLDIRDRHLVDLFPTEEEAHRYHGTEHAKCYTVRVAEKDVVFVVMEIGDHHDGGDSIVAITRTLAAARGILAKQLEPVMITFAPGVTMPSSGRRYTADDFQIKVWELQ